MSLDIYLTGPEETSQSQETYYDANITHNLNHMADEAGIYKHLWRPEEIGIKTASQLIDPLKYALSIMKSDPMRFKAHDATNGWGTYKDFVPWLERLLEACQEHPEAKIRVSR